MLAAAACLAIGYRSRLAALCGWPLLPTEGGVVYELPAAGTKRRR